ncbi:hypothetical protein [Niveispirillum irakense]|nr:hypothetical protein [Niveispirillum irakense]
MSAIRLTANSTMDRIGGEDSPLSDIASSVVALGMGVILTLAIALLL